ncbi:MAG TPA: thioredoxin TrxC [Rhodanobacteraceae bacterium]|nr:thioredoxin TrxC [Rhodanobacteraceae bacterium]
MADSLHIVCPHCEAVNRVPPERLGAVPTCGKCHRPLFDGHPAALNEVGFQKHLARNDIPVLVDFWAPWCAPCRMMAPEFVKAAAQLEPHVRLVKVDTEAEPALGARYNIRSIPTLALFHGGREMARQAGAMQNGGIVQWARAHGANPKGNGGNDVA